MTKLHVDINRSIAYYRTTLNGAPPKRVFLTGGSSQLPYLDLFIGDKLSLPVVYFNPLRNVHARPLGQHLLSPAEQLLHGGTGWPRPSRHGELSGRSHAGCADPGGALHQETPAAVLLFCPLRLGHSLRLHGGPGIGSRSPLPRTRPKRTRTRSIRCGRWPENFEARGGKTTRADGLYRTITTLGDQRDRWTQILSTLNDKMPKGVWITELHSSWIDTKGEASHSGTASTAAGAGQINMLKISGMYHSNSQTQMISPNDIRNFVVALGRLSAFRHR